MPCTMVLSRTIPPGFVSPILGFGLDVLLSPSSTTYVLLLSNLSLLLLVWFDFVSFPPICVSAYIPLYPTRLLSLVPVPRSFLLFVIFYLPPSLTPRRFPSSLLFSPSSLSPLDPPSRLQRTRLLIPVATITQPSLEHHPLLSSSVPVSALLLSLFIFSLLLPVTCRCRDDEMISLMYFYV
ncbi:hypothetical protein FA13DRAFT_672611 [Coprinellus micaceus]|uniref:Uncharacterized protein n=1 Tax=Coprinellus micaceus TaxID=71717 RepID=A0A4Y7T6R9_COPMI|nr:hypothetical protein FA13DRAFT_672611 [Coprinellus micaceus]